MLTDDWFDCNDMEPARNGWKCIRFQPGPTTLFAWPVVLTDGRIELIDRFEVTEYADGTITARIVDAAGSATELLRRFRSFTDGQ